MVGIMPDDIEKVTAKISEVLTKSDVVVTIGGSSVGVKDFVPDAVNALGTPGVVVQGVRCGRVLFLVLALLTENLWLFCQGTSVHVLLGSTFLLRP